MATRTCPHCLKELPATLLVAHSDDLECPHCGTLLEVRIGSRMPAIWIALAAAWVVWYVTRSSAGTATDTIDWVLPEVYAILAFGIVAPLVLMFTGSLMIAPKIPVVEHSGNSAISAHGSGAHGNHAADHGAAPGADHPSHH